MSIRRERKFNLFRTALAMVLILVMAITPASAASMNIVVIKGETEKKILYNLEPGTFVFPDNNHAQVDYVQKAQLFSNGTFVASNDSKKKNLEDCEYTFNENEDGTYTVKNSKEDIYLNFSLDENKGGGKCVGSTEPAPITMTRNGNGWNIKCGSNCTLAMWMWGVLIAKEKSSVAADTNFQLFVKNQFTNNYQPASEIEEGGKYLIGIQYNYSSKGREQGMWFVINPSTQTVPFSWDNTGIRESHLAAVSSEFTIKGNTTGRDQIDIGDNSYNIDVEEITDKVVDENQNTVFVRSGYTEGHNRIAKLTLSEGLNYKIGINPEYGATDIKWESTDTQRATVTKNADGTATITAKAWDKANHDVNIRATFKVGDTSFTKELPIIIYKRENTSTSGIFNFYVQQQEYTDAFYSLKAAKNANTDNYLEPIGLYEALYIQIENGSIDFYGKVSDQNYALTHLSHVGTPGQFQTIIGGTATDTQFYKHMSGKRTSEFSNVITEAMSRGCQAAFGYSFAQATDLMFISSLLPTLKKVPYAIERANDDGTYTYIPISDGKTAFARVDDRVIFRIVVTNHYSPSEITYEMKVNEKLDGAYFVDEVDSSSNQEIAKALLDLQFNGNAIVSSNKLFTDSGSASKDISKDLNNDKTGSEMRETNHIYYAAYAIKNEDVGRSIANSVELRGSSKAQFSEGVHENVQNIVADNVQIFAKDVVSENASEEVDKPQTSDELPEDIRDMPNKVPVYKTYFVRYGATALLPDFAGTNNLDCIGKQYTITSDSAKDATDRFKRLNDTTMLYTPEKKDEVVNYIITYYTEGENGTPEKKYYAVRVVAKADKFAAANLTIGSSIKFKYYLDLATVESTKEAAILYYDEANPGNNLSPDAKLKGTDCETNFPKKGSVDLNNYYVSFTKQGDEESNERVPYNNTTLVSGGKTYYEFTTDRSYPYEIGRTINAKLYYGEDSTDVINEKEYSIKTYAENTLKKETANAKLKVMLEKLLKFGYEAANYAKADGQQWIPDDYETNLKEFNASLYTNGVYTYQETDDDNPVIAENEFQKVALNNTSIIADWERKLEFEEGMGTTLKIYFKLKDEAEAADNLTLKIKPVDAEALKFTNKEKEADGRYLFTKSEFAKADDETLRKEGYYMFRVRNVAPFFWSDPYQLTFSNGSTEETVSYSVNAYLKNMYESDESSAELKALVKSMYNYGVAAKAWRDSKKK